MTASERLARCEAMEKLLRSIVADVDALRTDPPNEVEWNQDSPEDVRHWFGGDDLGYLQWPNLSILATEAKALLEREPPKPE